MEQYHLQYAKDIDGNIVNIVNAIKKQEYFSIHEGSKMYPTQGEINVWHYRCYPGEAINIDRAFHIDIQQSYIESKKFNTYQAARVLSEHEAAKFIKQKISNYSMIPDLLFLDENDNIMFILEIFVTHKKSKEDIEKIVNYKINTFELKYTKQTKFECQKTTVIYHNIIDDLSEWVYYDLVGSFDYDTLCIIKKYKETHKVQTFCSGDECKITLKCARFLFRDFDKKQVKFFTSPADAYEDALYYFRFKTPKYSVKNTEKTMRQTIINSNEQEIIVSHPQKPNFYCKFQMK